MLAVVLLFSFRLPVRVLANCTSAFAAVLPLPAADQGLLPSAFLARTCT